MTLAIGVDVGGTKIATALVAADGTVLASRRTATPVMQGAEAIAQTIADEVVALQALAGDQPLLGVGVGCPGHVDAGVIRYAVNLNWRDVPLQNLLAARLELPVIVANDVNTAALGEMAFGVAQGVQDFAYLAVGTGLGGAAVVGGRLLNGASGFAMELGQINALVGDDLLEVFTSGGGLPTVVGSLRAEYPHSQLPQNPTLTTHTIITAAQNNDPLAVAALEQLAFWLGRMAIWLGAVLNPSLLVIGGGMGHALYDWLMPTLQSYIQKHSAPPVCEALRLARSSLDDPALGAAALIFSAL